ncbi:MAG: hypothetical protein GEU88_10285 [Solirubrobacterales bacterium]|nr:hypothetical protein [Solirubrobacterales bacterium]
MNEPTAFGPRSSPPPAGARARPGSHGFAAQMGGAGSRDGRGFEREESEMATSFDPPDAAELLGRIARGDRLRDREKRGLTVGERLDVQGAERASLDSMSPQERLRAYRRGKLSAYQLSIWWSAYPREIPRINDVPEWIAATLIDVCEHPEYEERCRQLRAQRLSGRPT